MVSEWEGPSSLRLTIVAVTHRGVVRPANEDCVGVAGWVLTGLAPAPLRTTLLVNRPVDLLVADGMGGHRGGAEASRQAISTFFGADGDIPAVLSRTSEALHTRSSQDRNLLGMATTLVGLRALPDGSATVFNVGDSRAYRLLDGYLGQLSVDDRPALATADNTGVVTQFLGGERRTLIQPHLHELNLSAGDRLLLCSDGLSDVVADAQIHEFLLLPADPAAAGLLAAALKAGAPDNVSLLIVDVAEPGATSLT